MNAMEKYEAWILASQAAEMAKKAAKKPKARRAALPDYGVEVPGHNERFNEILSNIKV